MEDNNIIKAFSGYFTDKAKILSSASGGAASALAETIIKQGGVVFGAVYSDDFMHAEYACIESLSDLKRIKSSKYCCTSKKLIYEGVKQSLYSVLAKMLLNDREVLFIGLGCDVGAVKLYCKNHSIREDKLYCVEIICHGPTLTEVHEQFVTGLQQKYSSKIIEFNVRYKKMGWTPPFLYAKFDSGEEFCRPFYETTYGIAFERYARKSCYNCSFRGKNHLGDITVGDFWGISSKMDGWNKSGVSIILVQSEKGYNLLQEIGDDFIIKDANIEFALKYNKPYCFSRIIPNDYNTFIMNLKTKGLDYAVSNIDRTLVERIKTNVKKALPTTITKFIRSIRTGY